MTAHQWWRWVRCTLRTRGRHHLVLCFEPGRIAVACTTCDFISRGWACPDTLRGSVMADVRIPAAERRRRMAEHEAEIEAHLLDRRDAPPEPVPTDVCPVQRYGEHVFTRREADGRRYCRHCLQERA